MVQINFLQLLQCSIFHNILRTFTALPVLLDILLLTWGTSEDYEIVVKTLNSRYSLWINFFCSSFSQRCFDVYQHCKTRRWKRQRWFDVVRRCTFQRWNTQRCFNVDLTLSDVATSHQPKDNVETTLKCLLS